MIATLPKHDAPVLEDLIQRLTESLHFFRSFRYLSTRSADAETDGPPAIFSDLS